jgi:hypothetical protein
MEDNPYKAPRGELTERKPQRYPASWPIFVGTFIGAVGGFAMTGWIVLELAEGPDPGSAKWALTLVLSLVFGGMAGGLVADYLRRRR